MRTIIIMQKVEVHGWLLSGSKELFGFVWTDDTTKDSEETATID